MAVAGYVRTAVSPLQEAMRLSLSLTDNQMALLQGPAIGIPVALMALPLGLLIDRARRVSLLMALVVVSGIATVLTAFASSFPSMIVLRAVAGTTALAIVPVVFSLLADYSAVASRGRATTIVFVGQVAGNSAAFALGGVLLAAAPDVEGWRSALLWLAVPLLPVALLLLTLREPPRSDARAQKPSLRLSLAQLRHCQGLVLPLAFGIVLVETALGAMLIWSAPLLARRFLLMPDDIGLIMAASMLVSGLAGPLLGGMLADHCQRRGGPRRTVRALMVLSALGIPLALFAVAPGLTGVILLLVMAMTLIIAVAAMGMALMTIVVPNELRGLCMSVLTALILLFALAVSPVAVSLLSGLLGGAAAIGRAMSIVCVLAAMAAAALFAHASRSVSPHQGPE